MNGDERTGGRVPGTRSGRAIATAAVVAVLLAGCSAAGAVAPDTVDVPPADTSAPAAQPGPAGSALDALGTLEVKGRAPKTGYAREQFGQAWSDVDGNGCDTRNDVLRRDLVDVALKDGTNGCVVLTGTLVDPYTGTTIAFRRGEDTSAAVQIDHVVALSDAWQSGAQQLTAEVREQLANDPLELLAVDGPTNQAKGDGDAATWLPPSTAYRCAYVARQVAVKAKYHLWVKPAERDAIARVLADCPGEPLPDGGTPVAVDPAVAAPPEEEPADDRAADPQFPSCSAALDAGYGPYVAGVDPEYDWYRDGDDDGIVCEGPK